MVTFILHLLICYVLIFPGALYALREVRYNTDIIYEVAEKSKRKYKAGFTLIDYFNPQITIGNELGLKSIVVLHILSIIFFLIDIVLFISNKTILSGSVYILYTYLIQIFALIAAWLCQSFIIARIAKLADNGYDMIKGFICPTVGYVSLSPSIVRFFYDNKVQLREDF